MTYPYTPEVQTVRDAALARIAEDDAAGRLGASRRRDWQRMEWDLPAEPATVARTEWEDGVSDRYDYDPDAEVTHQGGSRWERNLLGEAWRDA